MADEQATPDVVLKKRVSDVGRKVMVGTFSSYAGPVDENTARTLFKMIDIIEDSDDVQNVFANFDVTDDVLEKISS